MSTWNFAKLSYWIWITPLLFLSSCFLPSCFATNENERRDHGEFGSRHLANKRLRRRFSKSSKRGFKQNTPANSTKSSKNSPPLPALLPLYPANTLSSSPSAYPSTSPSMYPSTSPSMYPTNIPCGGPCDDGDLCTNDFCDVISNTCKAEPIQCGENEACDAFTGSCEEDIQIVVPCVAVIDEWENYDWSDQWKEFRKKYPKRPFCLLKPTDVWGKNSQQ